MQDLPGFLGSLDSVNYNGRPLSGALALSHQRRANDCHQAKVASCKKPLRVCDERWTKPCGARLRSS